MRDARRGETNERDHVVKYRGGGRVVVRMESTQGTGLENGEWKELVQGVERREWEVRPDFATSEAVFGMKPFLISMWQVIDSILHSKRLQY